MMLEKWEEISKKKCAALLASIPEEWIIPSNLKPKDDQLVVTTFPTKSGWFTGRELEITGSEATELSEKLSKAAWSAEEVTRAFCKRAAAAHQLVLYI